jgi:GxxExxY protein
MNQRLGGSELRNINAVTDQIIGAAIEVHRCLGPGLLEPIYETALCVELQDRGLKYTLLQYSRRS